MCSEFNLFFGSISTGTSWVIWPRTKAQGTSNVGCCLVVNSGPLRGWEGSLSLFQIWKFNIFLKMNRCQNTVIKIRVCFLYLYLVNICFDPRIILITICTPAFGQGFRSQTLRPIINKRLNSNGPNSQPCDKAEQMWAKNKMRDLLQMLIWTQFPYSGSWLCQRCGKLIARMRDCDSRDDQSSFGPSTPLPKTWADMTFNTRKHILN